MASFRDSKGREWVIELNVGSLLEVRERTELDLPKLMKSEESLCDFLFGDATQPVKALWVLCEEQANERNINERAFYKLFDGAVLEAATEALLKSVANFSQRSKIGAAMAQTTTAMMAAMDRKAVAELSKKRIEILGSDLSLNSPESSE